MAKIRVGLIGLSTVDYYPTNGAWGVFAHLRSLRALSEYEIVAIANSTVASAQRSIDYHQLGAHVKAYGSAADIAADPNVDLVVVSTNIATHFNLAKPALEKRKNVFVEWPLGASVAEADELTRLAKKHGVAAIVGVQARLNPVVLKLKDIIDSGKIGRIVSSSVVASAGVLKPDVWMKGAEYYLDFKSGGNEFTIFFAHFLDTFTHVLGDFADVQGLLSTQYPKIKLVDVPNKCVVDPAYPKKTPDHILVQGTLSSSAVASIAFRKARSAVDGVGFRWIITGTDGEVQLTAPEDHFQMNVTMADDNWTLGLKTGNDEPKYEKIDLQALVDPEDPATQVPWPGTNTARVYQSFARGAGLEASFESATRTHHLLKRIAESAGWDLP